MFCMEKGVLEKYTLAGHIASQVREEAKNLVAPRESILDAAETIEARIIELGGKIAFPVNISMNEFAAHCTPRAGDVAAFGEKDVVKIDIGVHIDGYIADTAVTVSLDPAKQNMVSAVERALKNAVALAKPGVSTGELGKVIGETIECAGYKPVSNLSGHMLGRYKIHTGISIPNVASDSGNKLKEGDVIAIEPFLSEGSGVVKETSDAEIYRLAIEKPVRSEHARELARQAKDDFLGLPFALRWVKKPSGALLNSTALQLAAQGVLHRYPFLRDTERGNIAQAEHTVIVAREPIITTK